MRLQVKGKNVEVSDSLKTYAQEKLGKLDKHLNDAARLKLELAVEKNPSISENQIAEATHGLTGDFAAGARPRPTCAPRSTSSSRSSSARRGATATSAAAVPVVRLRTTSRRRSRWCPTRRAR